MLNSAVERQSLTAVARGSRIQLSGLIVLASADLLIGRTVLGKVSLRLDCQLEFDRESGEKDQNFR